MFGVRNEMQPPIYISRGYFAERRRFTEGSESGFVSRFSVLIGVCRPRIAVRLRPTDVQIRGNILETKLISTGICF